jgi:uncharacterized membrane protein
VGPTLFAWGNLWWFAGGTAEILRHVHYDFSFPAVLAFVALSCATFGVLAKRLDWATARIPVYVLVPALALFAFLAAVVQHHPATHLGYLAWPLAWAAMYWGLAQHEAALGQSLQAWIHALALWTVTALLTWEAAWGVGRVSDSGSAWELAAWALVPAAVTAATSVLGRRLPWPVGPHFDPYLICGLGPIVAFLALWSLLANIISDAAAAPLPYLPLLNPLDLAELALFLVIGLWALALRGIRPTWFARSLGPALVVYAALIFLWMNGVLLRTLHHWAGIPFYTEALARSTLVQASLSIFWGVLAFLLMWIGGRQTIRTLWFIGAALMAVVVLKLFTIDIGNVGDVARIVSFIGVALLMLVVGYLAPLPPRKGGAA